MSKHQELTICDCSDRGTASSTIKQREFAKVFIFAENDKRYFFSFIG